MAKKSSKKKHARPDIVRPVVFTGTRSILAAQVSYVQEVIDALRANVFISGGCEGIDLFCYGEAYKRFPKARHIIVIPYGYRNGVTEMATRGMLKRGHEILDMPKPSPRQGGRHPNLLRNDYMCELAMELNPETAQLCAFPGGAVEQQRSGTWATVRSARRVGIPYINIHPLSEAPGMSDQGVFESLVELNPDYVNRRRR